MIKQFLSDYFHSTTFKLALSCSIIALVCGVVLVACAPVSEKGSSSSETSIVDEHAKIHQFNYEDAKNLEVGCYISFGAQGGRITKLPNGYIVSDGTESGSIYLTDEQFNGKEY